jgi:hypothetical protein
MPTRTARLSLETLEDRATPATDFWAVESFDAIAAGGLPQGWQSWTSTGNAGFHVAAGHAVSGNSIASDGGSALSGRAWSTIEYPADTTVTASIFADTLIPAQVFVRGQNLNGAQPSYYAVSITRGMKVDLLRVVNGTPTVLSSLTTNAYVSGLWLDVTLIAEANVVQARVQRRDTGQWLNPFGDWQATPAATLTVPDNQISNPGEVGLARAAAYAGTVNFDDVRIGPANSDVTAPTPTAVVHPVSRVLERGTFAGSIRFIAQIGSGGPASRIDYLVDGELAASLTNHMFAANYDTLNLTNGSHTLTIRAWDSAGNVSVASQSFVVYNKPLVALPAIPQHYSHIRYAALAYNGLTIGPTEQQLLANSVDLVVPNARYLQTIQSIAPATPQLIYSNVSNLYLDLLTNWLNYADRNHLSRESAFYHVAQATPFTGGSPSSMPVNWFWNVASGPTSGNSGFVNLTSQSQSQPTGDVNFPVAGNSVYIGYPERFREINVALARPAGTGWQEEIEYPVKVDSAGRPTAWKMLSINSDSTSKFTRSGTIIFDPPADWKPAMVPGSSAQLYYVRVRTLTGSAATVPIASTILGRDYVGANGGPSGVIPAFDYSADTNHDGYLSDAEYAHRRPGFDARFEYESRLFYPNYGQMRFVVNPAGKGVSAWAVAYQRQLLAANPLADGIFMDNSGGQDPTAGVKLVESTSAYASEFSSLLGAIDRGIAPKWVLANTSGGGDAENRVARQVPATIDEFALRPMSQTWSQFRDLASKVENRLALSDPPGYLILDSLSTGGSPTDPRTQIAALAEYYLLGDPNSTFFMTWGGEEPASAWSRHWFNAIAYDVGQPTGTWAQFASGSDPVNPSLNYQVLARTYGNALVLYKPLSYAAGKGTGGTSDATATTHQLDGNYRPLNADGTLGPVTSTVTLRNGEGAILVRV